MYYRTEIKFYLILYGLDTCIITDNTPLKSIVLNPLSKTPKRLQSLLLRANHYNFTLRYQLGKSIPVAYTLSRAPLHDKPVNELVYANNVSLLGIKDHGLNDIRYATQYDPTMFELKNIIMDGKIIKLKHRRPSFLSTIIVMRSLSGIV